MKKVLPQIAFDFATEPEQQPSPAPAQVQDKAHPAGVGFRVKTLKNSSSLPGKEIQAPELPLAGVLEAGTAGTETPEAGIPEAAMPEASIFETDVPETVAASIIELPEEVTAKTSESAAYLSEDGRGSGAVEIDDPEAGGEVGEAEAIVAVRKVKSKRGRKSLKQVAAEADLIEIPADEILFRKQYYSMGEVAKMFRVNQSLLRFWETEFNILQPRKNKKGDRHFRPVDIKNLHLIYHLLRQRKYTIEGAKDFLKKNKKAEERFEAIQRLQQIRAFLLELKAQA